MKPSTERMLEGLDRSLREGAINNMELRGRYRDGLRASMQFVQNAIGAVRGGIQEDVYNELVTSVELLENGVKRGDHLNPKHPETWPGYENGVNPSEFTEAGGVAYNFIIMACSVIQALLCDYDKLGEFKRNARRLLLEHAAEASKEDVTVDLGACDDIDLPHLYRGAFEAFIPRHPRGKAYVKISRVPDLRRVQLTQQERMMRDMFHRALGSAGPACAEVMIDGRYMVGDIDFLYFTIGQTVPGVGYDEAMQRG